MVSEKLKHTASEEGKGGVVFRERGERKSFSERNREQRKKKERRCMGAASNTKIPIDVSNNQPTCAYGIP